MGKGNRNRAGRALDNLNAPAQQKKVKKPTPKWVAPLIAIVLLVVVVGAIVLSSLLNAGSFLRGKTALKSKNFEVSGTMFKYEMYYLYNNDLNEFSNSETYQSNQSLFEAMGWTPAYLLGVDATQPLGPQKRGVTMFSSEADREKAVSYADYTIETLKNVLTYCEAAKKDGMKLDEADYKELDNAIALYEALAQYYGYSNLDAFFNSYFGSGIKEKDVRATMELTMLADKFTEKMATGFIEDITDEEVETYYTEHYHDFVSVNVAYYTFEVKKADEDAETKWAEAQSQIAEVVALSGADGVAKFDQWMADHEFKSTAVDNVIYSAENDAATELSNFLFGENSLSEAASVGMIKSLDGSNDTYYSTTVYIVTKAAHRDELPKRNVAYFVVDGLTDETADIWIETFEKGGTKNADTFVTLASTIDSAAKAEDNGVKVLADYIGKVTDMEKGTIGCDAVDAYIYDTANAIGSYKWIKANASLKVDGETVEKEFYYFVFLGSDVVVDAWKTDVENTIAANEIVDWLENEQKNLVFTQNDKVISKI